VTAIGLLHPGQMGAGIGAELVRAGHAVLWLRDGRGAATARRAEAAGLSGVDTMAELLAGVVVVLSVCPPAFAENVAVEVATSGGFTGVYLEANAISPHRTIRIHDLLSRAGITAVDGCVIGPPPAVGRVARVYLSGPGDAVSLVYGLFDGTEAVPSTLGPRIGDASALKMAYGSYQKSSRALAAVSHALAERYGVGAALRAEAEALGHSALADLDRLPSVAARAWRWGPEMLEAAESFAAVGLPPELAQGAAAVFERWDDDKDDASLGVDEVLAHLHRDGDG
jgi:3-hydroxyisobutyrate dehydrogenase-like beta-hydroxyacid dehydrogenase